VLAVLPEEGWVAEGPQYNTINDSYIFLYQIIDLYGIIFRLGSNFFVYHAPAHRS
jgi:hypothetical protein